MMTRFTRLLWRHQPVRHAVLYGKPGCHLCEDAARLLAQLQRRYRLSIREVDITGDPELFRRYDIRIPVILLDGTIELEAPITSSDLRSALASSLASGRGLRR